jgi:hypothetical protein
MLAAIDTQFVGKVKSTDEHTYKAFLEADPVARDKALSVSEFSVESAE